MNPTSNPEGPQGTATRDRLRPHGPEVVEAYEHGRTLGKLELCQKALREIYHGTPGGHHKRLTLATIHRIALIALEVTDEAFRFSGRDVR